MWRSRPTAHGQSWVPQTWVVDGQPVLVFSCWSDRSSAGSPARGGIRGDDRNGAAGGVWTVPGETLLGPWDFDRAAPLRVPSLYAGHLVCERDGSWAVLGFRDGPWERFSGSIGDPIPVRLGPDGVVEVAPISP